MKKVLFVLKSYFSHNRPNALCVEAVARELAKKNVEVHYLSIEPDDDHAPEKNVFTVSAGAQGRARTAVTKLTNAPLSDVGLANRIYKKLVEITSQNSYDAVAAVVYPPEAAQAVVRLKEMLPQTRVWIYEIDSCSNRYKSPKNMIERRITAGTLQWEKRIYDRADRIIHMRSHEQHYSKKEFSEYKDKTVYLDIPCLEPCSSSKYEFRGQGDAVRLVYAGAFYPDIREPDYMLSLLQRLSEKTDFTLSVYIGKKYRSWLDKKIEGHGFVRMEAELTQDELIPVLQKSDILVSVGNKDNDSLPSKTLLYMSTGKPILHFYPDENDVSMRYLKHYPTLLAVDQQKGLTDELVDKACRFISEYHPAADMDALTGILTENTPAHTAREMVRMLYEDNDQA